MSIDIDLPRVRSLLEAGAQLDGPRADGLRTGVPVIAYCFDGQ